MAPDTQRKKSFTLTELLVSLVVFCLVMATSTAGFYIVFDKWKKQKNYMESLTNGRWALMRMTKEIRGANAGSINSKTGGSRRINFDVGTDTIWYFRGQTAANEDKLFRCIGANWGAVSGCTNELTGSVRNQQGGQADPFDCAGTCGVSQVINLRLAVDDDTNLTFRTRVRGRN
jgi:type II secretory pathway pseudopilin PulG